MTRVLGFQVEVYSVMNGEQRKISIHHIQRRRNAWRKFTNTMEQIAKTLDGYMAVTVVPIIQKDEQEANDGKGLNAAPAAGADQAGGQELAPDLCEIPGRTDLDQQPTVEVGVNPSGTPEVREVVGALPGLPV
jgi:hypothetical protein